jgi:iron complex outermembrane receptor protein
MPITRNYKTSVITRSVGGLLCAAIGITPGFAQDQAPVDPAPSQAALATIPVAGPADSAAQPTRADDDAPRELEEVVVTATKRAKPLREIPASITAFDGKTLEDQGKQNLNDYIQESPGVTANSASPGFIRISMRGISTDTNPASAAPATVGILIGDTAFTDPYISNITPDLSSFDLANVEVLKGPQGTLFGGAALSGAVRYVLNDPVMGEWQGRAFTQYVDADQGSDAFTEGVAINVPILSDGQQLAVRGAYVRRRYPGIYDIDRDPRQKDVDGGGGDQIRGILLWEPDDQWKIRLTHLSQDYDAKNAVTTADNRNGPRETKNDILANPTNHNFDLDSVEVDYAFESMKAVSLTSRNEKNAFLYGDSTAILAGPPPEGYPTSAGAFLAFTDDATSIAQEFRLQSTDTGDFQWIVGGYYYHQKVHFEILVDTIANQLLGGSSGMYDSSAELSDSTNHTTSLTYAVTDAVAQERAVFFDLSEKLWTNLELSAGARLYSTKVSGGFVGTGLLVLAANNAQPADLRNTITENGISPKLTATYKFTHDISVYAQASRGFRFGGIQSVPPQADGSVPATYKSDSLWNYEIGLRTAWLDNTLHADITGFYIDYTNPQVIQQTQVTRLNYYDNVSHAISQGIETSLLWLPPIKGVTLSFNAGLTDAHITEPFTASGGTVIPAGTQLPGAAKSQYTAAIGYFAPPAMINVGTNLSYTYIGKGYGDIQHFQSINDYGSLNAGVFLNSDAWKVHPQLAFNVSNILNTTAPVSGTTTMPLAGTPVDTFTLNAPRMYSVRLSLDF